MMRRRASLVVASAIMVLAACADVVADFHSEPDPFEDGGTSSGVVGDSSAPPDQGAPSRGSSFVPNPPLVTVIVPNEVAVSRLGTCAIATYDGRLTAPYCWPNDGGPALPFPSRFDLVVGAGDRFLGRVGGGLAGWDAPDATAPVIYAIDEISGTETVGPNRSALATGTHDCAVTEQGALFCWDDAGAPITDDHTVTNASFTAVANGENHTCVIAQTGTGATANVYCWGHNEFGQTGQPASATPITTPKALPLVPPVPSNMVSLASGANHGCALVTGQMFCWGKNDKGQSTVPALDGALSQLALGDDTSCVVVTPANAKSHIHCFGTMNGDIPGIEDIVRVAVSDTHGCAIARAIGDTTSRPSLFCWTSANGPARLVEFPDAAP